MNCIVAVDSRWAIGKDNSLLISIPEDMKYFRRVTTGKTVIYGRKTLESFSGQKPLPNRRNIVITHQKNFDGHGAEVVHSIEEAVRITADEDPENVFVIGGGIIYEAMLPLCGRAYVTKIDHAFGADAFFPNLDNKDDWEIESESELFEHEGVPYKFLVYRRS